MGAGTRSRRSLSCGAKCTKVTLIVFNIVFLVFGAGILAGSIYVLADPDFSDYLELIEAEGCGGDNGDYIMAAIIVFILAGVIIVGTAIMGMTGACCNSRCLLGLYAILMLMIILAEIGAGVLAIAFRTSLSDDVRECLAQQAHRDVTNNPKDDPVTRAWNFVQEQLECCGGKSHFDYFHSKFSNMTGNRVPITCCDKLTDENWEDPKIDPPDYQRCNMQALGTIDENEAPKILWTEGCYDALTDLLKDNTAYIIGVAVGIIVLEILGIVLSCMLIGEIRKLKGR